MIPGVNNKLDGGSEEHWRMYLRLMYCVATTDESATVHEQIKDEYPYSASDLLQPDRLAELMAIQAAQLGQPVNRIVGMMFAKRYSVFVMGMLSAMSLFDRMPNVAPDKVHLRITKYAQMAYKLADPVQGGDAWTAEGREVEAAQLTTRLLQEHIGPVFAAVSQRTGAHNGAMWSLLSANIQNMYLRMGSDKRFPISEHRAEIVAADRNRLLERGFGGIPGFDRNPLAVRLRTFRDPAYEGPPFYLRNACCLAHHLTEDGEEHGYCSTCPKSSPEERLRSLAREYG